MTGWLFILLSAGCSVIIAHLLKLTEHRSLNTIRVLTVNYITASAIAWLTPATGAGAGIDFQEALPAIGLALFVGVVFIANFFIYSKSVDKNGVGISVAAMRVSLIVPVLVSALWYFDAISALQWAGVSFVFIAMFLLMPNKRRIFKEPLNAGWLLILLFIGTGIGDTSLMVFEEDFSTIISKEQFMGTVFICSFVIGFVYLAIRGQLSFSREEIWLGIIIGVPNLYSAIFLISALEFLSGAVVYSTINILTVLGATVLGILRWGDSLTKLQWTGILLTLITILLLL